jgi:predicted ATP-dependent endonuclease of OLD family
LLSTHTLHAIGGVSSIRNAVNRMSGNSAVLIDEPELSLHIDWQEELLSKMMSQLGNRQIIVCTPSLSVNCS